jgi:hypothetical protein
MKESSGESKHLKIQCSLNMGTETIQTHHLMACGVTGIAFIDKTFVHNDTIPERLLMAPKELQVIDARHIK